MVVFRQDDITNGAAITLDRSQNIVASNESEARIERIEEGLLEVVGESSFRLVQPTSEMAPILHQCHEESYLQYLKQKSSTMQEKYVFDLLYAEPGVEADTPLISGIYDTALSAFRTAVEAAKHAANSDDCTYALCRPPGHHAGPAWMGGYCYLNNAVGAVFAFKEQGFKHVALLDLDYHFGNGSAAILKRYPECFFGSIHGSTLHNFPYVRTQPGCESHFYQSFDQSPTPDRYISSVQDLLNQMMSFGTDALVVSLGYDIIEGDPHGKWSLDPSVFKDLGALLSTLQMPICFVQEGGYHLPKLKESASHFIQSFIGGGGLVLE